MKIQSLVISEAVILQQLRLRQQAYASWPRLSGDSKWFKIEILNLVYKRLHKLLKRRSKTPAKHLSGLQLDWNTQLCTFIKLQLKAEKEWEKVELARGLTNPITSRQSRKELPLVVANSCGWSKSVALRILNQEVKYIRTGTIPAPRQGKHSKVTSWLSDEGTFLAMKEYISEAGEGM